MFKISNHTLMNTTKYFILKQSLTTNSWIMLQRLIVQLQHHYLNSSIITFVKMFYSIDKFCFNYRNIKAAKVNAVTRSWDEYFQLCLFSKYSNYFRTPNWPTLTVNSDLSMTVTHVWSECLFRRDLACSKMA